MRRLRATAIRLLGLLTRRHADDDAGRELASHLELQIDDNVRAGMTPEDARRSARLALGGVAQARERVRDRRGLPLLEGIFQDLRYAARTFRRKPGFAAAAILTLGLAVGVNTAVFSFGDGLAFRPPDVPRPGEIVRIFATTKERPYGRMSYPDYVDFRDRATTMSGVVAFDSIGVSMAKSRSDAPRFYGGLAVSGNYFTALELRPAAGRGLQSDDDRLPIGSPVAVISHRLWEREFGSDPAAIGRDVLFGTHPFTIVGVAPEGFPGTEFFFFADVYIPLSTAPLVGPASGFLTNRSMPSLAVLGRLKPGITAAAATADVAAVARSLEATYPATNRFRGALAMPEVAARDKNNQNMQAAVLLLGIAGLVLLIGCVNVANLLLSHATGRHREVAVRLAIGAGRGRLVRQFLTESALLAAAGGASGLAFAWVGVRYMTTAVRNILSTSDLPLVVDLRIGERAMLFALLVSAGTVMVFGVVPALRSTRVNLVPALKGIGVVGRRGRLVSGRAFLVAAQSALCVVILAIAGLSVQQLRELRRLDPGFRTDHVLMMRLDPSLVGYNSSAKAAAFYDRVLERLKTLPGASTVALAQGAPLSSVNTGTTTSVAVDGFQLPSVQETSAIRSNVVDPGYFDALRIGIVRGRTFTAADTAATRRVIVVNETMARRYWPDRDALGQTVHVDTASGPTAEVVGVVRDGKYNDINEPRDAAMYFAFAQKTDARTSAVVILRGTVDPLELAAPVRRAIADLDPAMPVFDLRSYEQVYESRAILPQRMLSEIMGTMGGLGLVLALVGLYSVLAYLTSLRTREIGIRMALGASRRAVLVNVLSQGLKMAGAGIAAGAVVAYLLTPTYAEAFEFVPPNHTALIVAPLLLLATALAATFIPAARAAALKPMVALRDE